MTGTWMKASDQTLPAPSPLWLCGEGPAVSPSPLLGLGTGAGTFPTQILSLTSQSQVFTSLRLQWLSAVEERTQVPCSPLACSGSARAHSQ